LIKVKGLKPNQKVVNTLLRFAKYNKEYNFFESYNLYRTKKTNYKGPVLIFDKNGNCVVLVKLVKCTKLLFKNKYSWCFQNISEINFNFKIEKKTNGLLFDVCVIEKKSDDDMLNDL